MSEDAQEEGREVLARMVEKYVQNGYRVEYDNGRRAIVAKRRPVNVLLNIALAFVTGGLWLIVLAVRLLNWPVDRVTLRVDEHGSVIPEFS